MQAFDAAQLRLYTHGHALAEFDRCYLQYQITWQRGDRELAAADFRSVLPFARDPLLLDRICAVLIATKDQPAVRQLWAEVENEPVDRRSLLALLTTARINGLPDLVDAIAAKLGVAAADRARFARPIDLLANRPDDPSGLRFLLATTDLPRETILALVAESVRQRLAAAEAEARRLR